MNPPASSAQSPKAMQSPRADIVPVIVGGDTSTYALGRAFHEAFGVQSISVSSAPIAAISRSKIFRTHLVPDQQNDEELLDTLMRIADQHKDVTPILMANTDWFARFSGTHRDKLEQRFAIPFPTLDVWNKVADKEYFSQLCDSLHIATPPRVVVDLSVPTSTDPGQNPTINPSQACEQANLRFPVVAKPVDGLAYDDVDFPEKEKVYFFDTPQELDQLWPLLTNAGFNGRFMVQEMIPGDDTCGISLTAYVDSHGVMTLIGGARVLVEDHRPRLIGNPIAMLTQEYPQLFDDAKRLFDSLGYTGFANIDVKIDPRDGTAYFFEINPRIGRNSYYMTAGGENPMEVMVADLIDHQRVEPRRVRDTVIYSLIPYRRIVHYLREPGLKKTIRNLLRSKKYADPMINPAEHDLYRGIIVRLQKLNHRRTLRRHYPHPMGDYLSYMINHE